MRSFALALARNTVESSDRKVLLRSQLGIMVASFLGATCRWERDRLHAPLPSIQGARRHRPGDQVLAVLRFPGLCRVVSLRIGTLVRFWASSTADTA